MTTVTLLTQADCSYCEQAKDVLARIQPDHPVEIVEISLGSDEGKRLAADHGILFAPGVLVDDEPFGFGRLSEKKFRRKLQEIPDGAPRPRTSNRGQQGPRC